MKSSRMAALLALAAFAAGCAGSQAFRQAQAEEEFGHWDFAVLKYAQAVDQNPGNDGYKVALRRAKLKASQVHFERGKLYRNAGNPDLAVVELEQAVVLDQTNKYAEVELRKAHEEAAKLAAERSAETKLEATKRRARGQRAKAPILEPSSDRPISLNFPTPKPIKQIYQSLAAAAGINVVFDPQLKDDNVTIVLNNIEFQKALETLMRQENHFYKVIDEKTILIAADNPQNRKTYEDLVLRTFYLSNGDLTDVSNAIRSLLQTTRISVNKAENSITLRDTADKVAIAERIVEQNDKQLSEVVIDVELLQVNSDKLQDLGLLLSSYSVGVNLPSPGGTTDQGVQVPASGLATNNAAWTWDVLKKVSVNSLVFTIPSQATLNFIKNNTDSELLAKPQLRISEGQKAQLIIGDKTPIPTTTFNTSTTAGTNVVPITSFTYQDVGIKIDVEPRVHHNREITLKLTLEVSQLGATINFGQGQSAPQIGTRTITSNIRLKDGETNFLAGLYRTDKTKTVTTIPFLGDIPVLGRLFSDHNTEIKSTDLVLTLTPHIIRIPDITEDDVTPVYVGTDSNISFQGSPRIESPTGGTGPFDRVPTPAPRGPGAPTSPPPQNLVPNPFPNDPFRQQPPPPQPTPVPQQPNTNAAASVSSPASEGMQAAALESTAAATPTASVFSFDTAFVSLAQGQQRSVVLRASGDTLTTGAVTIVFDPKIAAVTSVRPILASNGVADATIQNGAALLRLPEGTPLSGTRAIAEITLYGVASGRSALSVDGAGAGASVVIEVR
jgi:general secretion pathway protein D